MEDNIVLGGNIELVNFSVLEPSKLIVIKKLVGKYAKDISEKNKDFKKLIVTLIDTNFIVEAKVLINDNEHKGESQDENLFFALDKALSKLNKEF